MGLLAELKEEVTEDFTEDFIVNILQLEKLIDVLQLEKLIYAFLTGKPLLPMINETLNGFLIIPKSKQPSLNMLTGDIKRNRYGVHSIFT